MNKQTETKRLFNDKWDTYSKAALDIDSEFCKAIKPIFKKWADEGYSPREIAHIFATAVQLVESEYILSRNVRINKEEISKRRSGGT